MKKPKMPSMPKAERITPMPDLGGAAVQQAKFDAIKQLMNRRGRSSTLMTFYKKRLGNVSGRLSDVPVAPDAREGVEVGRG
jgi:hypothetical protein